MGPDDLRLLRDLLLKQRLVSVALVVRGRPVAGLLPFLAAPDLSALVVHASGMARHTAGLGDDKEWSGVIHEPDAPDRDALQVPRVLLEGTSRRIADERVLASIRGTWRGRYASGAMTLDLPDFHFFSLDIEGGRLIAGFGRALNLSAEHFARAIAVE